MRTIIIDSNYIGHQARYSMSELKHEEDATGVIFGFLSRILTIGMKFKSNDLFFVWDSKSSKRKEIFPEYKCNRKTKTPEEQREVEIAIKQFVKLRKKILPALGFNNVYLQPGYEGDDLIAKFVLGRLGEFIIVTADEDLFQCLQANTKIYNPSKKKIMTRKRFKEEYGIDSCHWFNVKALAGCSSDGVPGLRGIGEKTAIKYLTKTLDKKSKAYQNIIQNGDGALRRNLPLVQLPFENTKDMKHEYNDFNIGAFRRLCVKYGMDSFMKEEKLKEWKLFFEGVFE